MNEETIKKLHKVGFKAASLPIFSEVFQRSPWVYYGDNNLMPQYLIGQYNNCAIHKAIVTSKVEQIMLQSRYRKNSIVTKRSPNQE